MTPSFLAELVALLAASAAIAYVGQRFLRIVPLVGFLLAGVLIGPNALGLVRDRHLVEGAAEVGVILLLFTIGMEFSLGRLGRIKRYIFLGGGLQVALTVLAVTAVLALVGVPWRAGVFTGCLAALSSTVIVLKLLGDRGRTGSEEGQAALAILLFQDLVVVVMVLIVPFLGGGEANGAGDALPPPGPLAASATAGLFWALGKAAAIIALVLVLARRVMPPFLERVARTCSPDIFLLTVIAVGFGTAWLSSLAGLSVSLGAFLAGLVVSESRFSEHAFSELLPLRILFSAAFFISVGMLLDPAFLLRHPLMVAGVVAGVLLLKAAAAGISVRALGMPLPVAAASGLLLAQVGEFSFVLERVGREAGLYPAGLEEVGGQAFIAASVLLMITTPLWALAGWRLQGRLERRGGRREVATGEAPADGHLTLENHVIVAGYGDNARRLVRTLRSAGVPQVILTLSPDGAREAERDGFPVIRGDYARRQILEAARVERARVIVVADDEPDMAARVAAVSRVIRPEIVVVVQTRRSDATPALEAAGADLVVAEESAALARVAGHVLAGAGVPADRVADAVGEPVAERGPGDRGGEVVRLRPQAASSSRCEHARATQEVRPRTPGGCEQCLLSGDTWVHLRVCMTCGHVGCCDSSPNRHATKHFHATRHPVVRSLQPGEDWGWCYVDRVEL